MAVEALSLVYARSLLPSRHPSPASRPYTHPPPSRPVGRFVRTPPCQSLVCGWCRVKFTLVLTMARGTNGNTIENVWILLSSPSTHRNSVRRYHSTGSKQINYAIFFFSPEMEIFSQLFAFVQSNPGCLLPFPPYRLLVD